MKAKDAKARANVEIASRRSFKGKETVNKKVKSWSNQNVRSEKNWTNQKFYNIKSTYLFSCREKFNQ